MPPQLLSTFVYSPSHIPDKLAEISEKGGAGTRQRDKPEARTEGGHAANWPGTNCKDQTAPENFETHIGRVKSRSRPFLPSSLDPAAFVDSINTRQIKGLLGPLSPKGTSPQTPLTDVTLKYDSLRIGGDCYPCLIDTSVALQPRCNWHS